MKEFEDAPKKLNQYGNIKGKLSEKISSIVREHKFFEEHSVCPTCDQDIKEDFRVNRLKGPLDKAQRVADWVRRTPDSN